MKLQKSEDNNRVIIESNDGSKIFIGRNADMKYFSVAIDSSNESASFRIKDGIEEIETSVYRAFRELLDDILDYCLEVGFIRMEIDLKNKFIRTSIRNQRYNNLEIKLDGEDMDVVVTMIRGSDCLNNVVLLDNGDTLTMGYYDCFQGLLDKLIQEANRCQAGEILIHK